jgi:hypothetical protein
MQRFGVLNWADKRSDWGHGPSPAKDLEHHVVPMEEAMIVSDEVFGLDGTNDRYVRSILQTAGARAGEVIGVGDLLAAVVVERDPSLERLFRSLLRFPASPGALSAVAQRRLGESPPVNRLPRTRASFSPAALEALDRFETLRHAANGQPEGAVELLLVCILRQLSAEERKEWGILDVDAALALLRARHGLAESDSGRRAPDEPEAEQPAPFSAELGLIEDLTRRALVLSKAEPTLLEGEPEYELLFDRLARALHRPGMNAVLVGERGVGQGLLLAELAARAAFGRFVTLRERRFLLIGCRHNRRRCCAWTVLQRFCAASGARRTRDCCSRSCRTSLPG